MFPIKPLFIFSIGFCLGAAIVLYAVFTSTSSTSVIGLVWVPIYGCAGGLIALLINKFNSFWKGVSFVAFIMGCFVVYQTNKKIEAAQSQATSAEKLEKIYHSSIFYKKQSILMHLASNPNTPQPILLELSKMADDSILAYLGSNVNAPEEMLNTLLLKRPSYSLHWGLAANPRLTETQAKFLTRIDPNEFESKEHWSLYQTFVLAKLIKNSSLPLELRKKIESIPNPEHFLSLAIIEYNEKLEPQKNFLNNSEAN